MNARVAAYVSSLVTMIEVWKSEANAEGLADIQIRIDDNKVTFPEIAGAPDVFIGKVDNTPVTAIAYLLAGELMSSGYKLQYTVANGNLGLKFPEHNPAYDNMEYTAANVQQQSQGKPHGTLLHDAVEIRDRFMNAAKMSQIPDSCLYLIWYDHNATYQPRLIAVSEGSLVYTEDITDSPWYTASELAWMIAASITGSGGKYRITKQPVDCRLFGVPKGSIYSVFLIENNR